MHEGIINRAFEIHNVLGKIEIFPPNSQVGWAIVVHKRDVELLIFDIQGLCKYQIRGYGIKYLAFSILTNGTKNELYKMEIFFKEKRNYFKVLYL